MNNNMTGDTFNFNSAVGQFVAKGDGFIHDYHAQSVASSSSVQKSQSGTTLSDAEDEEDPCQLSNRQAVIMMTGLLGITLSPDYTNQLQLARFLSRLTGRSMQSIRQTIMSLAKNGIDTPQARRDCLAAADALDALSPKVARMLRTDAEE